MTSIGRNQFLQQTMGKTLELNRISPADNQKLQQHGFNLQELQQLDINKDGKIAGPDETNALLQKLDEFEATSGVSPQVMDEIKKQLASLFREAGPGQNGGIPQPGGAPTAGNQRGAQGLNAGNQPMAPPRQASAPRPRGGQQQPMSPLQQAIASGNPPRPGDEGPAVAELQQLLKALGLPVDVNGKFDEKTLGAVQQLAAALQQATGQGPQQGGPQAPGGAGGAAAPAGGAGAPQAPSGSAPMGGPQAAGQNPMQGLEGPQVAQLQQMLKALGLPVDVNGKLDGKTMEALTKLLEMLQQALTGEKPQGPQQKGGPQGGAPAGGGGGAPKAPKGGGGGGASKAPKAPQGGGKAPAPAGGGKAPAPKAPAGGNAPKPATPTPAEGGNAPKATEGGNAPTPAEGGNAPNTTPVNNTAPVNEANNNTDPGGVTSTQLRQIVPSLSAERAEQVAPHLNRAMAEANINTPQRQAMFVAQVAHESGGFKYNEEIASGAAYEGRTDLGNTQPGDGRRFKGRGFIQLTGRDNYTRAGRDLGLDLVNNPGLAAEDGNAARVAAWYWNSRDINSAADSGDFTQVTRLINGGTNGLADRQQYYARAREALGI